MISLAVMQVYGIIIIKGGGEEGERGIPSSVGIYIQGVPEIVSCVGATVYPRSRSP